MDGAPTLHSVYDLLAEARHNLVAGSVVHGEEEDDQPAAGQSAQISEALHEHDFGAAARGRRSRRQARRATAHHQHVGLGHDGQAGVRQDDVAAGKLSQMQTLRRAWPRP